MARPKTPKGEIIDNILDFAGELTDKRVTAERRKEIAAALITEANKIRFQLRNAA